MKIENRKILIIAPKVFSLISPIQLYLEGLGYSVDFVDDRFEQSFFRSILLRFFRRFYFFVFSSDIQARSHRLSEGYRKVLIINGEALSLQAHKIFNDRCSDVRFYTWDSTLNKPYLPSVFDYYKRNSGRVMTFDLDDSVNYEIDYQPLFADKEGVLTSVENFEHESCFVGTMHSDRLSFVRNFLSSSEVPESRHFIKLFCKNRLTYSFQLVRNLRYVRDFLKFVEIGSISADEFTRIMMSSSLVLDYTHPLQSGLTHRSIFALQNGKPIMSNNPNLPGGKVVKLGRHRFYQTNGTANVDYSVSGWCDRVFASIKQGGDANG